MFSSRLANTPSYVSEQLNNPSLQQIKLVGLQQLTLLDALIKQASAMQATLKVDITKEAFTHFVSVAGSLPRPLACKGVDANDYTSTALVEFRKRSSASVLSDAEVEVLEDAGLKPQAKVISPFLFAINPAYAHNKEMHAKLKAALDGLVPDDFLVQCDEVTRKTVTDEMLDEAFNTGASEQVLEILTTMAFKPRLSTSYDMNNLVTDALEVMQPTGKRLRKKQNATSSR